MLEVGKKGAVIKEIIIGNIHEEIVD